MELSHRTRDRIESTLIGVGSLAALGIIALPMALIDEREYNRMDRFEEVLEEAIGRGVVSIQHSDELQVEGSVFAGLIEDEYGDYCVIGYDLDLGTNSYVAKNVSDCED